MMVLQAGRNSSATGSHGSSRLEGSFSLNATMGNHPKEDHGDLLLLAPKTTVRRPPMFRVIMLNDDFTPMDFVVLLLKQVFRMSHEDAISTMLQIHHQGKASCGVFTRDVAETKADMAISYAREHEYPLQCTVEQE